MWLTSNSYRLLIFFSASIAIGCFGIDDTEARDPQEVRDSYATMRIKELKTILFERSVACDGCIEKSHFVDAAVKSDHIPRENKEKPSASGADGLEPETLAAMMKEEGTAEDVLEAFKDIPGMAGLKMFTADQIKNMNPEELTQRFGNKNGGSNDYKKITRKQARERLSAFYANYGIEGKEDTIEKTLDIYEGKYEKMFAKLHKKYKKEMDRKWDETAAELRSEL